MLTFVLFGSTALIANASVSSDDQEGWQTKHVVGRFYNADPPKEDEIFKFQYRVINGTVDEFKIVRGSDPIVLGQSFDIKVSSTADDAVFEVMVPRNFPYTNFPSDTPSGIDNFDFFPKGDGTIEYTRNTTDCFFVFSVPVTSSIEMSLAMTAILNKSPYHGDEIPDECTPETVVENVSTKPDGTIRPSHQVGAGVAPEDVMCPSSLELILNPKGKPYCATEAAIEFLDRVWNR